MIVFFKYLLSLFYLFLWQHCFLTLYSVSIVIFLSKSFVLCLKSQTFFHIANDLISIEKSMLLIFVILYFKLGLLWCVISGSRQVWRVHDGTTSDEEASRRFYTSREYTNKQYSLCTLPMWFIIFLPHVMLVLLSPIITTILI